MHIYMYILYFTHKYKCLSVHSFLHSAIPSGAKEAQKPEASNMAYAWSLGWQKRRDNSYAEELRDSMWSDFCNKSPEPPQTSHEVCFTRSVLVWVEVVLTGKALPASAQPWGKSTRWPSKWRASEEAGTWGWRRGGKVSLPQMPGVVWRNALGWCLRLFHLSLKEQGTTVNILWHCQLLLPVLALVVVPFVVLVAVVIVKLKSIKLIEIPQTHQSVNVRGVGEAGQNFVSIFQVSWMLWMSELARGSEGPHLAMTVVQNPLRWFL